MSDTDTLEGLLRRGLGRAVLFLRDQDATPFRALILDACRQNWNYDPQIEGDRAQYLFDVLQATGEPAWYTPYLREALLAADNREATSQLSGILRRRAEAGDTAMRPVLRDVVARNLAEGDTTGAEDLIVLDEVDGYRFVAGLLMRHPLPDEELWQEHGFLQGLEDRMGQEQATAALGQVVEEDADFGTYLDRLRERWAAHEARLRRQDIPPPSSYNEVRQHIEASGAASLGPTRWMENADDALVRRLAQDFLREEDPDRLRKYLRLFVWRAFPLSPDRLIELATYADHPLRRWAVRALTLIEHPTVRVLGRELLRSSERSDDGVRLLMNNYREGDYGLVEEAAHRNQTADDFHSLEIATQKFIEANPRPEAIPILMHLYEEGCCGLCRWGVVEILAKLGPLPAWIREECRWDAYKGVREFVRYSKSTESGGAVNTTDGRSSFK